MDELASAPLIPETQHEGTPLSDKKILILATGGTIDKVYVDGELTTGAPAATWMLDSARLGGFFEVESIFAKDSLDVTDEDRESLAARVAQVREGGIVITHGTDTMTDTADYLKAHEAVQDGVVVILTGAMQPAGMRDGDAMMNLGAAITAAQLLPTGIHIAMSGRVFPAGDVVKDRAQGRFVSTV